MISLLILKGHGATEKFMVKVELHSLRMGLLAAWLGNLLGEYVIL